MGQKIGTTWAEDDDTPIDILDLSVRTYNCLKRHNISTVRQLFSMRKNELLSIRNLTPQNYEEIREQLIVHGFMHPTQPTGPFTEEENDDDTAP